MGLNSMLIDGCISKWFFQCLWIFTYVWTNSSFAEMEDLILLIAASRTWRASAYFPASPFCLAYTTQMKNKLFRIDNNNRQVSNELLRPRRGHLQQWYDFVVDQERSLSFFQHPKQFQGDWAWEWVLCPLVSKSAHWSTSNLTSQWELQNESQC
jgi:hypothetical protein